MTQFAIIKKLTSPGKAEVEVLRGTACGDSCGSCEVCSYASKIRVEVNNALGAQPGDRVEIETRTSRILGAAALVYVLPFVLFFIGYFTADAVGAAQGACILTSFICFAFGLGIAVLVSRLRSKKPFTYDITKIISSGAAE